MNGKTSRRNVAFAPVANGKVGFVDVNDVALVAVAVLKQEGIREE